MRAYLVIVSIALSATFATDANAGFWSALLAKFHTCPSIVNH